ncbi:hypothetical protein AB0A70_31670 [Streptomyces morookaense]|uniref:right-handed parallel beta-helix repeat-containing protein n=1 Tax=Streptomyces morookaense TaxID=1970 RepID=UPI0034081B9A
MIGAHLRKGALTAAAVLALSCAGAVQQAGADSPPDSYYLDCAHGDDGSSGKDPGHAWKTLDKASSVTFRPGDRLVLRRGTQCGGTLAPKGSGAPGRPITVGAYGTGAKPEIAASGAQAAVLLRDVQGWELRDLDLSNHGGPPGPQDLRFGIYVVLTDFGTGSHYVVENVDVHDVNGCECQNPHQKDPSGGIVFKAAGTRQPTGFDDVVVQHNTLTRVDRQAIGTSSDWERRAEYPDGRGAGYVPMTRVRVLDNRLTDIGGDGIGIYNAKNARVERNVVRDYSMRTTQYSAGLFAYNSDGTVFRFNDVSSVPGSLPAQAFFFETANVGTVFEYNFSHGNSGGALAECNDPGATSKGNVFRYNISQDDKGSGTFPWGDRVSVINLFCGPVDGTHVYGNTFYTPDAENVISQSGDPVLRFTDNVFVGRAAGSAINDTRGHYDHNLYYGVQSPPTGDSHAVTADPRLLAPGTATSPEAAGGLRLRAGSPALDAGTSVADNGGRDYFGNPIPPHTPNIGAYTGPGVR